MKFQCDKCKTRYSIGEDRVRGKILKIRCKNCGNVITVREGMDVEPSVVSPLPRSSGTTTPAPAALEEEWYVSIDGVQSGPMALPEAQKWVASKSLDADLYCWSEGFDDWLPVDKVSHFRNLRKPPPPVPPIPARPAQPRAATAAPPPNPAMKREEPKPLFASTMAALEKEASQPSAPAYKPPAVTPTPAAPPRSNGLGGSVPTGKGSGPVAAIAPASEPSGPRTRTPSGRFQSIKSSSATAAALTDAFDAGETADARTQIDAAPVADEPAARAATNAHGFDFGGASDRAATATPFSSPKPEARVPLSALASAASTPTPVRAPDPVMPAPSPVSSQSPSPGIDDDDLQIGEVSRVVKLTDIVPRARTVTGSGGAGRSTQSVPRLATQTGAVPRLGTSTGAVPRIGGLTGSQPKFSPTDLGMNVDPSLVAPGGTTPDESVVAHSFAERHRRGLIGLVGFAVLLVAGVIGLVAYMTSKQTDEVGGGLGGTREIDTSRPEDLVRRQLPPTPIDTGSNTQVTTKPKWTPRPNTGSNTTQTPDEDPKGDSLRASEIEEMAAKNGEGTKRCYMRAQKGALGFEIADVKKIAVTLSVGKDGTVSSVDLSSHQDDSFGQCLIARIKGWRFRESPSGGTFRISLAFSNE